MKKFILFYQGPAPSADASHDQWPAWFRKVGDKLVDMGSPLQNGLVLHHDGSASDSGTDFNGYSIIQAENIDEALNLTKDHPILTSGEYSVEIFELAR